MKVLLAAAESRDGDSVFNGEQIRRCVKKYRETSPDLICFGESFLQGFEGLSWNCAEDLTHAMTPDSTPVRLLRALAAQEHCALSFGFIEKDHGLLYSSYLVVNSAGGIADVFRRVSPGWKEPVASAEYREGKGFHTFSLNGKTLTTAICGDLWDDTFLREMEQTPADAVLWPIYVDFSVDDWRKNQLPAYAERTAGISCPILLINSFVDLLDRANGGCAVFHKGRVLCELPMGRPGVLEFVL